MKTVNSKTIVIASLLLIGASTGMATSTNSISTSSSSGSYSADSSTSQSTTAVTPTNDEKTIRANTILLWDAVYDGDLKTATRLLEDTDNPANPNLAVKNIGENTVKISPMLLLAYMFNPEIASVMLEHGGNKNTTSSSGKTMLSIARGYDLFDAVVFFEENKFPETV